MVLTKIQNNAVEEIYSHYSNVERAKVEFKSPTGSGKTLMAAWLISNIIERNIQEKFIFVVATPSTSSLPFFFAEKINVYKRDLPYSKFDAEYIESPSSRKCNDEKTYKIKIIRNKVYVFGKSTFGARRIFTEQHVIDDFINEAVSQGYKIIYIRDEAHIGDSNSNDDETRKFEELMQKNAHFVLKMTATPNFADPSVKIVVVKESDINDINKNENKWLLKTEPILLLDRSMSEEELLENAISKYKEIKKEYNMLENNEVLIHPALLIQISNEPSNIEKKRDFLKCLNEIKEKLNYYNLSWVQYFGDSDKDSNRVYKDNFTLDDITKSNNDIDVIMFKVGPSTGWDIPRACMLLQLRKVCSDKLNIQTIGRIKRNPYPNLIRNSITDKYYIYSNSPRIDDDILYYNFDVKNALTNEEFPSIQITNKDDFKFSAKKDEIKQAIFNYIKNNKDTLVQDIRMIFVNENGRDIFKNELYEVNGSMVYSVISNPFIFLKIHKRLIESKNHIYSICQSAIKQAFDSLFKNVKIYDDIELKIEHLEYVLIHKYTTNLQEIIRKESPFLSEYKLVMSHYEPKNYTEVYNSVDKEGQIDNSDKTYLFDIKKNGNNEYIQPLDSKAEKIVFDIIKQDVYGINTYVGDRIKVWCKNGVFSSINGDYFDSSHAFHKSYFDFILKFSNGAFLYIEVKNKNDIDEEKTKVLKETYKEYFKNTSLSLFKIPLVICVWTVDENDIYTDTFYDETIIKENLKDLTARNLIKTIANLSFEE